jgi:hypothetical protein
MSKEKQTAGRKRNNSQQDQKEDIDGGEGAAQSLIRPPGSPLWLFMPARWEKAGLPASREALLKAPLGQ